MDLKMSQGLNNSNQHIQNNTTESLQIVTSNTEPLIDALASINLNTEICSTNRNKILMKTSTKSFFKRKTEAELIKDNILKCRYNRRVGQLKELTQNNVQMFLRIKAQDSHYKYKTIHHENSYKILPGKTSRVQSHSHTSTHTNSQTQLAREDLKIRCLSLKKGLVKEFKSTKISVNQNDQLRKVYKSTEIGASKNFRIETKVSTANNKQNQGQNYGGNHVSEKYLNKQNFQEVQNRVVSKKLGLLIPVKDVSIIKANNFFRRKQQNDFSSSNISKEYLKRKEDSSLKQFKREELSEKTIDQNHCS